VSDAEEAAKDCTETADQACVRWRPWPCESCAGGATPLGFIVRCLGANPELPEVGRNQQIDWYKTWEAARLLDWIQGCHHSEWAELCLPRLDEGSEHLVLFDEATSQVVKVTRPGTYGDHYEIIDGRITQFDSRPSEYLLRMRWWEKLFSGAPNPIGMTASGQIVSRQKFVVGDPAPPQGKVDQFLIEAGAVAVRQSCWLWKKEGIDSEIEVWIGDARSDNFVMAKEGIIPIDIRIWGVSTSLNSS
jgi:hypothetical protein